MSSQLLASSNTQEIDAEKYSPSLLQSPTQKYKDTQLKEPIPLDLSLFENEGEEKKKKLLNLGMQQIEEDDDSKSESSESSLNEEEGPGMFVNEYLEQTDTVIPAFPILDLLKLSSEE